jgi:hypothetical protein
MYFIIFPIDLLAVAAVRKRLNLAFVGEEIPEHRLNEHGTSRCFWRNNKALPPRSMRPMLRSLLYADET